MKAKAYFEKYGEAIMSDHRQLVALQENTDLSEEERAKLAHAYMATYRQLCSDLKQEVIALIDSRNVQTDHGALGVLREINSRWNAIGNLFEKKYKTQVLARDGFMRLVAREFRLYSEQEEKEHE